MGTQYEEARTGNITAQMIFAADAEKCDTPLVAEEIREGRAVLPANPLHVNLKPVVVGRAFRTKVNANIGRSVKWSSEEEELTKLDIVMEAGADFVMDLSVGSGTPELRAKMLSHTSLPLGTVPVYEAFWQAKNEVSKMSGADLVRVVKEHAEQGVDFMTIHAGLLRSHTELVSRRKMGIVSRGGAIIAEWMACHDKENPFYSNWDAIMDICRAHDVTVSLGDGLRPGCLEDASDDAQFAELDTLGALVLRCRSKGVQVMVEGPGHVPFNQIQMNMEREAERCFGAPFYVLGPVVTDIAPGYDHITSSIGATAAAFYGASLLCYVTPSEHLCLPDTHDVRTGIIAHRIAAHAADVARGLPGARDADDRMASARMAFDWEEQFKIALDGKTAREKYVKGKGLQNTDHEEFCTMCGKEYCAVRTTRRLAERMQKGKS